MLLNHLCWGKLFENVLHNPRRGKCDPRNRISFKRAAEDISGQLLCAKAYSEIGVAWISEMEVSREQWRLLRLDGVIESSKNVESHNKGNGTREG